MNVEISVKDHVDLRVEELKKSDFFRAGTHVRRKLAGKDGRYQGVEITYFGKIIFNTYMTTHRQVNEDFDKIVKLLRGYNYV